MAVLGLHHAHVLCPPGGEAQARRFYVQQLGLRERPKPDSLRDQGGCWFAAPDGGEVHITPERDLGLHPRRHFALRVDDVATMRTALEGEGVRSEDAIEIPGVRRCYVFDPFGNKVELHEIT
jgi:catechol 2,3-dioxygenase-like lactoylglutathione lyase family enzyme